MCSKEEECSLQGEMLHGEGRNGFVLVRSDSCRSCARPSLPGHSQPAWHPADSSHRLVLPSWGLPAEGARWASTVEQLRRDCQVLTGDVLLAAAFVTYAGPFSSKFRLARSLSSIPDRCTTRSCASGCLNVPHLPP